MIKAALIVAAAILMGVALYLYYSPYQQCVRARPAGLKRDILGADYDDKTTRNAARISCAQAA